MKFWIFNLVLLSVIYKISGQVTSSFIKKVANDTCGISTGGPIIQQLSEPISYAGGLFWSDNGNKIAYVDRYKSAFGRYTPIDGRFNHMELNVTGDVICVFPIKNAPGLQFVIGVANTLILANVLGSNNQFTIKKTYLMTVTDSTSEVFVKGRTDANGRLWYVSEASRFFQKGNLYKIENLGKPEIMEHGLQRGAGMAWSKDNKYFYLVDNVLGVIYKYDFNLKNGTISNRRIIFSLENFKNLDGQPFDLVIDTQGYLWIGMNHGGAIIQYDENTKSILWTIPIPATNPISLEFGNPDKKTLFVGTTRRYFRGAKHQPGAGSIFSVSGLGATGITDNDIVIPAKYYT